MVDESTNIYTLCSWTSQYNLGSDTYVANRVFQLKEKEILAATASRKRQLEFHKDTPISKHKRTNNEGYSETGQSCLAVSDFNSESENLVEESKNKDYESHVNDHDLSQSVFTCDKCPLYFMSIHELKNHICCDDDDDDDDDDCEFCQNMMIQHEYDIGQNVTNNENEHVDIDIDDNLSDNEGDDANVQEEISHNEEEESTDEEESNDEESNGEEEERVMEGGDVVEEHPYSFRQIRRKILKKTKAISTTYEITFNQNWRGKNLRELHTSLYDMFEDVIQLAGENLNENDLGQFIIHHPSLNNPIYVSLRSLKELTSETVMNKITECLNSNENLRLDEGFNIMMGTIAVPEGGSHNTRLTKLTGKNNSIFLKKSMVEIINKDRMCLARAIIVSWCKLNKLPLNEWKSLIKDSKEETLSLVFKHGKCPEWFYKKITKSHPSRNRRQCLQKIMANLLCEKSNTPTDRHGNLNDIENMENVLNCRILVLSAQHNNKFIRIGNTESKKPVLYIYLVESPSYHFHAITSITGFLSVSYFCSKCLKHYNDKKRHNCESVCIVCYGENCYMTDQGILCTDCNMTCRNQTCFEQHKESRVNTQNGVIRPSKCHSFWKCPTCMKTLERIRRNPLEHRCEEWLCQCCKEYVDKDHLCYQRKKKCSQGEEFKETKFIFFDVETRQDDDSTCAEGYQPESHCRRYKEPDCEHQRSCENCHTPWCGKKQHIANFLVSQSACASCQSYPVTEDSKCDSCGTRCEKCLKKDNDHKYLTSPCAETCGSRQMIFEGDGCHITFCEFLFMKTHDGFTVVSHNGKAFDNYFILEYMIDQSMYPSKAIYNGSKIMYMEVQKRLNIRFIDL
jgi:hypothetical protein